MISSELQNKINLLPTECVGTGQCVALVQNVCDVGLTVNWLAGPFVQTVDDVPPGTIIATFDQNGRYGNHTDGSSHAAIYICKTSEQGITVYDQWIGHSAQLRDIYYSEELACNSAKEFRIVTTSTHPNGIVAEVFKS